MFAPVDTFARRHLGSSSRDIEAMLQAIKVPTLDALVDATVPKSIQLKGALNLPAAKGEFELLTELKGIAAQNQVFRSFIGCGYSDTVVPGVILRNILLNPGWYTAYTPYQAEIAQGRLQALLNFQTMVSDLTGLPISNASLLDEGTAAAEAMHLAQSVNKDSDGRAFFISALCHPQTIEVVKTRAKPLGIKVIVGDHRTFDFSEKTFAVLLQYPATDGSIFDYRAFAQKAREAGSLVIMAADLLAMTLLTPPGELGADIAVGSAQRFGVPMGFGGPHAAYLSTRQEYARSMPGRIIGASEDAHGNYALRMALQTREQHIRREKATSNICTAQVLLSVMAGMYAVYHGPQGLKANATRVHGLTRTVALGLKKLGFSLTSDAYFDTLSVQVDAAKADALIKAAQGKRMNLRKIDGTHLGISLDETVTFEEVGTLLSVFGTVSHAELGVQAQNGSAIPEGLKRTSAYLTHQVFNSFHTEHEMLRYIRSLEAKDLSLCHSMIPLGSCTMKLNATSEMEPVTWPEFGGLHPFAPAEQWKGYQTIFTQLEQYLSENHGLRGLLADAQRGSQGEYAGLLAIRSFHEARGQGHRNVCLIPASAHGTNPASAVMAGYKVVVTKTDESGNVDVADLKARALEHKNDLAALMITYPSTHGVFETSISEICEAIHAAGGQVYMTAPT